MMRSNLKLSKLEAHLILSVLDGFIDSDFKEVETRMLPKGINKLAHVFNRLRDSALHGEYSRFDKDTRLRNVKRTVDRYYSSRLKK